MVNLINRYYIYRSTYDDWKNKQRLIAWWIKKAYYETGAYQPVKL